MRERAVAKGALTTVPNVDVTGMEVVDETALSTLDVLLIGNNYRMSVPVVRAIARAVRGGVGLLNEYWIRSHVGTEDDPDMRDLMLAASNIYNFHMPGMCGDPLSASGGGNLLETAAAYLDGGLGLEGTARTLFVHPNTVRYRLAKIADTIGYDLTDPHDAQTVRLALAYGRVAPEPAQRVPRPSQRECDAQA